MGPQPDDVIGGKYRVVRLIGDGGMGAVYEARHEVLGAPVALKFLHAELARKPGLAQRFLQEARVSASIQSPHVTRVTDVDQTADGSPYLVMELLKGESLQQLLDRELSLNVDRALDFALQILAGLEAAHALGVVHRDLKPDNVFITPSAGGPVLKLLDFGIAKLRDANEYKKGLTRPGAVMGTPEYMAPEQLYTANQVDHRADIYSIGAMLYEMLSGKRPADGDDAPTIIAQVAQGQVVPLSQHVPSLASDLVDAIHRAMAPLRERRFATATEFRLALAPFAHNLSHAGRLAATPTPIAALGEAAQQSATPPGAQDVLPSQAAPAVPPTLPPEDDAPRPASGPEPTADSGPPTTEAPAKGQTQDAPVANPGAMAPGRAAVPAAFEVGTTPAPGFPAPGRVPGYGPPLGAYPRAYGAPPPVAHRRSGRALGAIIAVLLGLVVTGGIIAAIVIARENDDSDRPPLPTIVETPPATVTAQGGVPTATDMAPSPDMPSPMVPPAPVSPHPGKPPRSGTPPTTPQPVDAGASDGGQSAPTDAGSPSWQIPGLPPIPATPPPLPSGWPTIPGITPPPASSP